MENQFKLLREEVQKHNNPAMNVIVDLLEEYNHGLSHYFKDREITRDFMDLFDRRLTAHTFRERFGVDVMNKNMAMQQLMMDLNTLARSTWYFEREDGKILTGQTLYENKAVYMASLKVTELVYGTEEDAELAKEINEIKECGGIFKNIHNAPHPFPDAPESVGVKETYVEISGEENISTINDMVSLIQFHAMCNESILLDYLEK